MIEYIEGKISSKTPTYVVIDTGGIAYRINISLNTYDKITDSGSCKLLTHLAVKEDSHTLYGFSDEENCIKILAELQANGLTKQIEKIKNDEIEHQKIVKELIKMIKL